VIVRWEKGRKGSVYTTVIWDSTPAKITQGDNSTEYKYDSLGRLTGVSDSNKGQANYVYQADEEDIRLPFDDRTKGATSVHSKVTSHNQTQAQLQYASVSGSPWQAGYLVTYSVEVSGAIAGANRCAR
jgi:YD repeat-containing protein